jgi:Flp pilus assembly protein TadD
MSRKPGRRRRQTAAHAPTSVAAESRPPDTSSAAAWVLAAAIVVLAGFAYAPVRQFDFVQLDDPQYVTENPHVRGGLTMAGMRWAFTTGHAANWHPLTWISHMLDVALFGVDPGAMHLVNVVLHITSALLLFFWLRRTTGDLGPSAFVAALFACHPAHVESVAWIAERKDVLSGLFWMLTLWAYLRFVQRRTTGRYAAALITYALGLTAKPMLVTLPFVLILLDYWPLRRLAVRYTATLVEKLPFLALAAVSSAITFVVQQRGGAVTGLDALPAGLRLENAVMSYAAYLGTLIWPVDLTIFYGRPVSVSPVLVAITAAGLIAATIVAVRLGRRLPHVPVGWLWYLGTLVPVIGLVQVGVQAMADRYTYLPFVGLFVIVAWSAQALVSGRLGRWRPLVYGLAVIVVVTSAALTRRQVGYWRDNTTLFAHATELTAGVDAVRAHNTVGARLLEQGRIDEALASFREARRLAPSDAESHYNLGLAYARQQRFPDAIAALNEAVRLRPDYAEAYAGLGMVAAAESRLDHAVAHYREAVRLNPGLAGAHNNLGTALANQRRMTDAVAAFAEAVRVQPDFHDARLNLATALATLGRTTDALGEIREVLRRDPANGRARAMLASLGGR